MRKRSKNKNKSLEGEIPLPKLQVNENAKGETAKPDGKIYAGFGKVNQAEYSSARLNQQEDHYEDPNKWAKELQDHPPQANYVGMNELEIPPKGNSKATTAPKIHLSEYEHIKIEGNYSDPNAWAKELQNNPPQPNYVNVNSLEVPNGENANISRAGYDEIPVPAQVET